MVQRYTDNKEPQVTVLVIVQAPVSSGLVAKHSRGSECQAARQEGSPATSRRAKGVSGFRALLV